MDDPSEVDSNPINEGLSLAWKKVSYSVSSWGRHKLLLSEIWGLVLPGETLAIMGPSGSGKTTLLNLLADKVSSGKIEGEILINGKPRNQCSRGNVSYVYQENNFMEVFTVRETLDFHVSLARPLLDRPEKKKLVGKLLEDMGLVSCQDTLIGNAALAIRGISSGQSKRVALALALISNPGILLLDEPTSKLDSSGAFNVMKSLKTQAEEKGKTVIFSIHQPSSEVFALFDKLLLLSKGRMGFFGTANDASAYFRKFNRSNFAKYSNPSDQMLLLVNSDFSGNEEVLEILDDYDASSEKRDLIDSVDSVEEKDYPLTLQKASFLQQFGIQTVRLFKYVTRSPSQVPSFIAGLVVVTFAFWYLISDYDDKHDMPVNVLLNVLFFIVMNCGNASVPVSLVHTASIHPTFHRERLSGLIDCLPFSLAMLLVSVVFEVLGGFIIAFIEYFLVEINNVIWFGTILAGTLIAFGSAWRTLPLITSNPTTMICIFLCTFFMQMFTSGFLVGVSQLKFPFEQLSDVSVYKYVIKALIYNEYNGERQNESADRNVTAYMESYQCLDEDRYLDLYFLLGFAGFFQMVYFLLLIFRHDGKQ